MGLMQSVWIRPLEALAKARDGDVAGAETLIETTAADCYLCLRVRGQIATEKHDWPTAERWFAEATRQAPSLPFAFTDWGVERLAHGDTDGAIAVLQRAHEVGASKRQRACCQGREKCQQSPCFHDGCVLKQMYAM